MILDEEIRKLLSKGRNWIEVKEFSLNVYMRVTERYVKGKRVETLEIGTVEVDTGERGKGNFKKFLKKVEEIGKDLKRIVFIENVLEPRLCKFLQERGYEVVDTELLPCFYKEPKKQ